MAADLEVRPKLDHHDDSTLTGIVLGSAPRHQCSCTRYREETERDPMTSDFSSVELLLSSSPTTEKLEVEGREIVRQVLASLLPPGNSSRGQSIAELVADIAEASDATQKRTAAIYLVRWLAVPGLLPANNKHNQIDRLISSLFDEAVPDLAKEFGTLELKLTHEKVHVLETVHAQIVRRLEAFQNLPHEQNPFLALRSNLLTAVNNGLVRRYLGPFEFERTRKLVTASLSNLKDLVEENGPGFDERFRELKKYIEEETSYARNKPSPVTESVLGSFCIAVLSIAEKYHESAKILFQADIEPQIPSSGVLDKKLPLHEEGRILTIRVPFRVVGKGFARRARAQIIPHGDAQVVFEREEIILGDIAPGPFALFAQAMILAPCTDTGFSFIVEILWSETGSDGVAKSTTCEAHVTAQPADVDWNSLEFQRPYTTEVARGDSFVGRSERVSRLANHLLRSPMESFFVTGQKRVGKTSLALASVAFAKEHELGADIEDHYLLWGAIAHNDSLRTLQSFGQELADLMLPHLPKEIGSPLDLDFSGSLAPLVKLARLLAKHRQEKKFVVLVDEIDEMHPDLYRQGQLAETFFANIRALTTCENVAFVLIGGENMPFVMDRQGQKLNKFIKEPLDYYSRDLEWSDYAALVRQPTRDFMNWHEAALVEVFNVSNGNPFFTNHICAQVLRNAVNQRDNDITRDEVKAAVSRELSTLDPNSFVHLWQDGALSTSDDAEAQIMRRRRLLVAVARTLRTRSPITVEAIERNKNSHKLLDVEIPAVLAGC